MVKRAEEVERSKCLIVMIRIGPGIKNPKKRRRGSSH